MSELISFIVGLFLPPIVEYAKTKFPNNKIINYSIALIFSILVGVLSTIFEGKFNTSDLGTVIGSIGTSLLASQTVYNYYWKNSQIAKRIENLRK